MDSGFCPPLNATFSIGSSDKDPLISSGGNICRRKSAGGHRPSNKVSALKYIRAARAKSLHKLVASRSSTLRQGKLAEVRAGLGGSEFDAIHAAAKEAFSSLLKTRMLNQTKGSKRQRTSKFSTLDKVSLLSAEINPNEARNKAIFKFTSVSSDVNDSNGGSTTT